MAVKDRKTAKKGISLVCLLKEKKDKDWRWKQGENVSVDARIYKTGVGCQTLWSHVKQDKLKVKQHTGC